MNELIKWYLRRKPGEGLGWSTEPRKEAVIGFVDRRLTLKVKLIVW